MALNRGDLVLCSGTLPRDVSFRARVNAAVAGRFRGISMWGRDYARARADGHTDHDIREMIADAGLAVAEVDPAWWWLPGARETGESIPEHFDDMEVFRFGPDELLRIAEAIGARSLNAVDVFGGDWTGEDAAECFAALCDRSREHGLLVQVEFLPWSKIPDLVTAAAIVRDAGCVNGGVAVDSWHFARSNSDLGDLPRARRQARHRRAAERRSGRARARPDPRHPARPAPPRRRRVRPRRSRRRARRHRGRSTVRCRGVLRRADGAGSRRVARRAADATRRVLTAAR